LKLKFERRANKKEAKEISGPFTAPCRESRDVGRAIENTAGAIEAVH
jgi:hypothetical protein